ncbi:MAG: orotidine-5'-phosphate decarboxylase [Armatimonadota bacterium]
MENFADRLCAATEAKDSRVCVGLDPRLESLPRGLQDAARARRGATPNAVAECFVEFNRRIIEAVRDVAVVVKAQVAFYEAYGPAGMEAFRRTLADAREAGLLTIADAKRNDIGSTAQAYARAYLGGGTLWDGVAYCAYDADAVTVNAYLGSDGIAPFIAAAKDGGKGVFVLVKTSNPSSGELQDAVVEGHGQRLYERLAQMVAQWGEGLVGEWGYSSVGAVVGATYPEVCALLRQELPTVPFLVPGYGAQGATAADVAHCFDQHGMGAVVNSSRGIIFAYQKSGHGEDAFAQAAREAAQRMRDEINEALAARE